MGNCVAILSDIHGNLHALQAVMNDLKRRPIGSIILLGDLIDYGLQSNEVIAYLREELELPVLCNIFGNHERAIMARDFSRFSSPRGAECAQYTERILTSRSRIYIEENCNPNCRQEFALGNKKCLAVHGSLEDIAWKGIMPDNVRGDYREFDFVFSGHTHYSHCFMKFYNIDDPSHRNKKPVTFINPGSVGQPRNHNPNAQYALLNVETFSAELRAVPYDFRAAMSLYHGQVDDFYRLRLEGGI